MDKHSPQTGHDEPLPPFEAAKLLTRLLRRPVSERTLESWRTDPDRARPLAFVKLLGGRIRYKRADVEAFAASMTTSAQLPKILQGGSEQAGAMKMPPAWQTTSGLTAADLAHADFLVHEGGRPMGEYTKAAHASLIDRELGVALGSLSRLVRQAGTAIVQRMAVHHLIAARGSIAGATPDEMVDAARSVATSFDRALADWRSGLAAEAAALAPVRAARRPLRQAVGKRIADLVDERARVIRERDQQPTRQKEALALAKALKEAGVPDTLAKQAINEVGQRDPSAEQRQALNAQVGVLAAEIDRLRSHLAAAPGEYTALDGLGFDELIAQERAALGLPAAQTARGE